MKNDLKTSTSGLIYKMIKLGTLVGTASLLALSASAQTNSDVAEEDEVNRLGTITVTARKKTENLQDVPISVTAFTGDFFRDSGLVEFADISALTPNFDVQEDAVQGALFSNLTIRGQSALNAQLNADQAVGIVINGAPITRGTNLFSNLFDVEQVEVLKGPQGTLFGKNTTGGTVIVRTTAPQLGEFSGYAEVDIGNFDRRDFEGVINIPIGDKFALRFGAAKQDRDGFGFGLQSQGAGDLVGVETGNDFADDDELFIRGSALFEPNDRFSIRVNADYHDVDEAGSINRVLNDGILVLGPGIEIPIALATPGDDIFAAADQQDFPPVLAAEEFNINATVSYDFGPVLLESITSYRDQESTSDTPFAATATIFNGQDADIFAQEVRLSGEQGPLKWQTGFFYSTEEGTDLDDVGGSGQITAAQNDTISVFAQGTYAVTDRLNVTGGIRYTDEDRGLAQIAHATESLTPEFEASFDDVSWTIGADYAITDDVLAYGTVSRGFRSGAIDDELLDVAFDDPLVELEDILVDPEFVLNYEIGLKGDFFNNTLRWNSALWFSDYTDIQVQVFDPTAVDVNNVGLLVLRNAGEATLWGFESEVQFVPTSNLTLGASLGYTFGEFDEFLDETSPGVFDDRSDEPIGGPEWQFSAFARYEFDVLDYVRGGAQLNFRFRGDEEIAGPDDAALLQPGQDVLDSYWTLNGQIDFDVDRWGGLNVAFYGRNITDEEFDASGFGLVAVGLGLAQRIPGAPATYGVRIRKTF
ncbi:MAG: TonB-dependent receptor [Hyphomonadaceae bacterium]